MKLKEWINQTNNLIYQTIKTTYPVYFEFVEKRYINFELKYPQEIFESLITSFVLENKKELQKIQNIDANNIDMNNLGEKTVENNTVSAVFEGINDVNYVGFDSTGTFNKNDTNTKSNQTNNKNITKVNLLNELIKLNNLDLSNIFNKLNANFEQLLITIVSF